MNCKHCGAPMEEDARICPACGQPQDEPTVEATNLAETAEADLKEPEAGLSEENAAQDAPAQPEGDAQEKAEPQAAAELTEVLLQEEAPSLPEQAEDAVTECAQEQAEDAVTEAAPEQTDVTGTPALLTDLPETGETPVVETLPQKRGNASRIAILALVVLVLLGAAFAVWHFGLRGRKPGADATAKVLTQEEVDAALKDAAKDVALSEAEYRYYYMNSYYMVRQYAGMQGYYYGVAYDYTKMPDEQEYTGEAMFGEIVGFPEDQTPMWSDYIIYTAKSDAYLVEAAYRVAIANGIALDDADRDAVEQTLTYVEDVAASNGQTADEYLKNGFGDVMTLEAYRGILEKQRYYQKLMTQQEEGLAASYPDETVETEFDKNKMTYGVISYRTYALPDGANEAQAQQLAAATSEADFLQKVSELAAALGDEDAEAYRTDDTLTLRADVALEELYAADFADWISQGNAETGATFVSGDEESGFTVWYVTEALHKPADQQLYSIRHILVLANSDATAPDDEIPALEYTNASDVTVDLAVDGTTARDKASYQKAQNILQEYLEGEHTEAAFSALAKKYSEDGNGKSGGLYADVAKGTMVEPFETWCLKEGRTPGTVGIVETTYGNHVMYFVGLTTKTWQDDIRAQLAHDEMIKFAEGLQATALEALSTETDGWGEAEKSGLALVRQMLEQESAS